jgi:thioredoxin-related protein
MEFDKFMDMLKMRFYLIALILFLGLSSQKNPQIQWLSLQEAYLKVKSEPRKVFVDVYTDWCGWCKKMDRETFASDFVAQYANQKFYAVKLNAEQRDSIVLGGKVLRFIEQGQRGYHEAAIGLLNGKMSYPSIVFLDENFAIIDRLPGYKDAYTFHQMLTFLGENYYKKTPFDKFVSEIYPLEFENK